jgi:glycosyltransferase involved in cell wall biosynthesis
MPCHLRIVKLKLAGDLPENYQAELEQSPGWKHVDALGFINRKDSIKLKETSIAGLVTFLPYPNHIHAQPNKIFEYMASGLPVIGSNFPLWKEIIEENNCGICVNPENPKEISEAINKLSVNPSLVQEMGNNGKRLVIEKYNWSVEESKLISFYKKLIG